VHGSARTIARGRVPTPEIEHEINAIVLTCTGARQRRLKKPDYSGPMFHSRRPTVGHETPPITSPRHLRNLQRAEGIGNCQAIPYPARGHRHTPVVCPVPYMIPRRVRANPGELIVAELPPPLLCYTKSGYSAAEPLTSPPPSSQLFTLVGMSE